MRPGLAEQKKEEAKAAEPVSFIQNRARAELVLGFFKLNKGTYEERRSLAHEQMKTLNTALCNPRKDHSDEFARYSPQAAALLKSSYDNIKSRFFKKPPYPPFPKDGLVIVLKEADVAKISQDGKKVLASRTIKVSDSDKNQYLLRFSRDLSSNEKKLLGKELAKWRREPNSLAAAFARSGVFADQVLEVTKDRKLRETDSLDVIGRSMIRGPAHDFIYREMGLANRTIAILERALAYRAARPAFNESEYFRKNISDPDQRGIADIAFLQMVSDKPLKGAFSGDSGYVRDMKSSLEQRNAEMAAFRLPFNARNWNVASLSTGQGLLYLTIPKTLLNEEKFEALANSIKMRTDNNQPIPTPEELKLIFGLPLYADTRMVFRQRERGAFKPPSDTQLALLERGRMRLSRVRLLGKAKTARA